MAKCVFDHARESFYLDKRYVSFQGGGEGGLCCVYSHEKLTNQPAANTALASSRQALIRLTGMLIGRTASTDLRPQWELVQKQTI